MTNSNETTAYDLAFNSAEEVPQVQGMEATDSKRTDRPATAMIRRAEAVSDALEAVRPMDARLTDEMAQKLAQPMTNLRSLFNLLTDDLETLPTLQAEMIGEIKPQMAQIEKVLGTLDSRTLLAQADAGNTEVSAAVLADLVFTAVRGIRTPVANMQGMLSLVLDDRSALSAPVAGMLLLAFEQLEKLAKIIDEISETANVINGQMDVRTAELGVDAILALAIEHAQEEGFDYELVRSNQVPSEVLAEIGANAGQCLEQMIRHALLDTLNYPHEMPIGLFLYANEEEGKAQELVIEVHDFSTRPTPTADMPQKTLDQQVVCEMAKALNGSYRRNADETGAIILTATIPFGSLRSDTAEVNVEEPAVEAAIPAEGLALLAPARILPQVLQMATENRLAVQRVSSFAQMIGELASATVPTVLIDADLLQNISGEQMAELDAAITSHGGAYVLQHGEADVSGAGAMFPMLWDDDMLAITGVLEQAFKPGMQQENLTVITGDNAQEVRPWRKLLSSTGNGAMWWPAARPIAADRFPGMVGSVVVVAETTNALPATSWKTLSDLKVRDRKIIVLTGTQACQLPRARGWDVYRPNLSVCDDTLRRYILFNSPEQRTPRVAVIEDDILMRKLLVSTIEDQAKIVEMGSVQEALTNLRTMSFDVILLDLFLPDGSGLSILKAIQNDPTLVKARSTPIIALTGSSDLELNETVRQAGATEILVKPVPMQVLRQKIALLTRENRSRRITGAQTVVNAPEAATQGNGANTPAEATDLPVVAPLLKTGALRTAGMSKIISLRAVAAASQKRAAAHSCAIGD